MYHTNILSRIRDLGGINIPDFHFGDIRLPVFPFHHTGDRVSLPLGFEAWEEPLNQMLKSIPVQEGAQEHFVTIDSKWFSRDEAHRREGVHIDGNFCADYDFSWPQGGGPLEAPGNGKEPMSAWGGGGWAGLVALDRQERSNNAHVHMGFKTPYPNIRVPVGRYVSSRFGGTLVAANQVGCDVWPGQYDQAVVGDGGSLDPMLDQVMGKPRVRLEANKVYLMSSDTPHESFVQDAGTRRTLLRVTLAHNYDNTPILPM